MVGLAGCWRRELGPPAVDGTGMEGAGWHTSGSACAGLSRPGGPSTAVTVTGSAARIRPRFQRRPSRGPQEVWQVGLADQAFPPDAVAAWSHTVYRQYPPQRHDAAAQAPRVIPLRHGGSMGLAAVMSRWYGHGRGVASRRS